MYCSKCGNFVNDGDSFCPKCGTPVSGDTAVSAAPSPFNPGVSRASVNPLKKSVGRGAHVIMILFAVFALCLTVINNVLNIIDLAYMWSNTNTGYVIIMAISLLISFVCSILFLVFCCNARKNAKPVIVPFIIGFGMSLLSTATNGIAYGGLRYLLNRGMLATYLRYAVIIAVVVFFYIAVSDSEGGHVFAKIMVAALLALLLTLGAAQIVASYRYSYNSGAEMATGILTLFINALNYTAIALCALSYRRRLL